jgi:hypothetical protein
MAWRNSVALGSGYRFSLAAASRYAARAEALHPSAFSFADSLIGRSNPAARAFPGT